MIRITWRDTYRGAHFALAMRHVAFALLFALAVFITAIQPAVAQSANDGEQIGYSDVFLQSGTGHLQGPYTGNVNLNTFLGADRFYNAGYTGTNAVMANVEAGYIWNGHEALSHVGLIPTTGGAGEYDRHATWVGMIMGGRPGGANPGEYQRGMAPDAQLASGSVALYWPTNDPSYPRFTTAFYLDTFGTSMYGPYRAAFITGVPTTSGLRTADVINSSWVFSKGSFDLAGIDNLSGTIDALISENPRTLVTWAAGNTLPTGAGPNMVPSGGSAYNNFTVAALAPNGTAYDIPSVFSNGGPNDYGDSQNGFVSAVRQVVDIAAPGESFSTAYYGGQSGGNGPNVFGPANDPAGGPDYYSRSVRGTSFAAPTVAGGAALLYDAAYAQLGSDPDARDSRVMKAVLMNSADKTQGWDNGQSANPNGLGGVLTTRGVDNRVGAGRMNLNKAFDQFLSGTRDVTGTTQGAEGVVNAMGWDFGQVNQGTTNDYVITNSLTAGTPFTATLTWFRDRQTVGQTSFTDLSLDNLDLELWSSIGGIAQSLISASNSIYNNTEHFTFSIPTTGQYMLRVRWTGEIFDLVADANLAKYGLAWSATAAVPEPGTLALVGVAISVFAARRRHA
jgi:hypothetical protein